MHKFTLRPGVSAAGVAGHDASDDVLNGTVVLELAEVRVLAAVHDTATEVAEVLEQPDALAKPLELELSKVLKVEASETVARGVGSSWVCAPAHHSQSILWARGTAVTANDTTLSGLLASASETAAAAGPRVAT